jgi:hypothetical protein
MPSRFRFSGLSVGFGVAGLIASIAVTEFQRVRKPGVGYILQWMDRLGLIRKPGPNQSSEWRPDGLFELTDDQALKWVLVHSICFALWAILLALFAEHRREKTVGQAVGFILGALALHIYGYQYSIAALCLGGVLLTAIRHRQRPNPSIERTSPGKPGDASHVKR